LVLVQLIVSLEFPVNPVPLLGLMNLEYLANQESLVFLAGLLHQENLDFPVFLANPAGQSLRLVQVQLIVNPVFPDYLVPLLHP
jgi:hypothetical protein